MEKKFYSKPSLAVEAFVPQDFVAACVDPQPTSVLGRFDADVCKDTGGYEPVFGSGDGIYNGSMYEGFQGGQVPSIRKKGTWVRNITLYREVGNPYKGAKYSNTSIFNPFATGDLYFSNVAAYFWEGGAPDGVTVGDKKNLS